MAVNLDPYYKVNNKTAPVTMKRAAPAPIATVFSKAPGAAGGGGGVVTYVIGVMPGGNVGVGVGGVVTTGVGLGELTNASTSHNKV